MKEHIDRKFYPENEQEEINILKLRKSISEMEGCLVATVCGECDYPYIDTIFVVPFTDSNTSIGT